MMSHGETIAAIATPPGRGGIGVIRVSGTGVEKLAGRLIGQLPRPREATLTSFKDTAGNVLDRGIAIFYPAPGSYTGEDVLELQGHGGPVLMQLLLEQCLKSGARIARPGEFTERAFLNRKMDLAQAEAVADLIDSSSEQAVRAAQKSLRGEFSARVHELVEQLIRIRMHVESAIDFPEEEIDLLDDRAMRNQLDDIQHSTQQLLSSATQGRLLNEGMVVVIAGRPNAGKSSLLNALVKTNRAIVSEMPGTTRDTIEANISIDGMPVTLIDTAGLREVADPVESEGVRRTRSAVSEADLVLNVIDDSVGGSDQLNADIPAAVPCTRVYNKIDVSRRPGGSFAQQGDEALAISATRGQGLDEVREHLKRKAGYRELEGSEFMARTRHLEAIKLAQQHIVDGLKQLTDIGAGELLAEELRLAQRNLSEITGEFSSDQLLSRIFSSFCIGK